MKTTHRISIGLVALSLAFAFTAPPARAQIYVSAGNGTTDTVGKYNPDGSPVNTALITLGVAIPGKMTLSGGSLFVGNSNNIGKFDAVTGAGNASFITTANGASGLAASGTNLLAGVTTGPSTVVAEYDTTTGNLLNGSFITPSGFGFSIGLLVSGGNVLVSFGQTIGKYNAVTGAVVNALFITTTDPVSFGSLAVFGGHLFVLDGGNGVREYDATTGSLLNGSFIAGLLQPASDIAISGGNLLVATGNGISSAFVSEYDATSGALVNQTFITPSQGVRGLAVVPEPTTLALAAIGALALLGRNRFFRFFSG